MLGRKSLVPISKYTSFLFQQQRTLFRPPLTHFPRDKANCLQPFMSADAFQRHYYEYFYTHLYKKLNAVTQGTVYVDLAEVYHATQMSSEGLGDIEIFNAAANVRNHEIFFDSLITEGATDPDSSLSQPSRKQFYEEFGGVFGFQKLFTQKAKDLNGSGWIWLINRDGQLEILPTRNNDTPECLKERLTPILCLDMWEHAYVDDYGSDIEQYVHNFWKVLNWDKVEARLSFARRSSTSLIK